MPILIDEVVISVQVDNQTNTSKNTPSSDSEQKQRIVEECVEQVMEILKQQQEP